MHRKFNESNSELPLKIGTNFEFKVGFKIFDPVTAAVTVKGESSFTPSKVLNSSGLGFTMAALNLLIMFYF